MATLGIASHAESFITLPIIISGQYTATAAGVIRFPAWFAGRLKYLSATARASGGTNPTLDVDIQQGITSLLSSAVSVTAGSDAEATLAADPTFAKDAVITIDLTISGTNPTWDDITLLLQFEKAAA